MRTKTKSKKMNEKMFRQMDKRNSIQNNNKNTRKHVKPYDLEKAAIIYLQLFTDTPLYNFSIKKMSYRTF